MLLLASRAFACSPYPGVVAYLGEAPVRPGTVVRGWTYMEVKEAELTRPSGEHEDLPLLDGAPAHWGAVQLPTNLEDGTSTLVFDDHGGEKNTLSIETDALAPVTPPESEPEITNVVAEVAHGNGDVYDTGAGGPWAQFTVELDTPPAQSSAWIVDVSTADGDPAGWAWLSYPHTERPVTYTLPLSPGSELCFHAQLHDPFDTPVGSVATRCATMPDAPVDSSPAPATGCGCATGTGLRGFAWLPLLAVLRRRRLQR